MLSQAEHDMLASAILLTDDITLAEQVQQELEKTVQPAAQGPDRGQVPHGLGRHRGGAQHHDRRAIANRVAPNIWNCACDPWALLPYIRHAGAVFMGQHSPEPVGDYFAGPNHVLPTLRTARFVRASVQNFCKRPASATFPRPFLLENAPPSLLWPV